MRNTVLIVLGLVILASAQTAVPSGILSMGTNPVGYCSGQTAPTGLNGNQTGFICTDLGGVYFAPSGQKFSLLGGTTGPSGKNCTNFKVNTVNSDGSWNVTCGAGWQ